MYRCLCSGLSDVQTHSWKKTWHILFSPNLQASSPDACWKVGTKTNRHWVGHLLLKPHCFLETHCAHLFKLQPAQWTLLSCSKPGLAQHSCLMEMAVSLLLKWCAQCAMRVLGTERCTTDTTEKAKGFGHSSSLLKGMDKKIHLFPSKMFVCR